MEHRFINTIKCPDMKTPISCKNIDGESICVSDHDKCCVTGSNINKSAWCPSQ